MDSPCFGGAELDLYDGAPHAPELAIACRRVRQQPFESRLRGERRCTVTRSRGCWLRGAAEVLAQASGVEVGSVQGLGL
jgi:hypothetical protein